MTRAVGYARVSSLAQRERDTIAAQLRSIPEFIARQGWKLVKPIDTYVDDGLTAKAGKLDQRRGLARLLKDAAAGAFDVVVVVDLDRLSRSEDITERGAIIGAFQRAGVRIATTSGQVLDLSTSTGDLFATLQAFFAAEENRKRRERVLRGKLLAAQRGGKATGRDPYGLTYDKASNTWSLDPVRAPIVREIFERAATEEKCGSIAFDLEVRGVPAPGARWNKNRIRDMIRSRYAVGEYIAHRASRTVVAVPPIVSEDLWQRAQDALDYNRTYYLRKTRHVYLLERLAVCSCGAPMRIRSANINRGRWRRPAAYFCAARCGAKAVPVEIADATAWSEICRRIEEPGLARELAELDADQDGDAATWEKDAAAAQAHLDRLVQVEQTIMARFRRGLISEAALDTELAAIRRERAQATAQAKLAAKGKGSALGARARLQAVSQAIGELREALAAADLEDRRDLVRLLVDPGGARFDAGSLTVTLWLPRAPSARKPSGALVLVGPCSREHESRLRVRVVAKLAA